MFVMTAAASAQAGRTSIPRSSLQRMPALAVRVAVAAVPLLIAATVGLHAHTGSSDLTSWWFGDVALAALLLVPGALVAAKRPGNVIGWLLLLASVTTAVAGAGREYLAYGFLGGTAPGYLGIGWVTDSFYLVSMATLPLVLIFFPDGHLLSRRVRPWVAVPVLSAVLGTFSSLFFSDVSGVDVQGRRLYNPGRHVFPSWVADGAGTLGWLLFVVSVVMAIVLLVLRYRRSHAEVRLQMKWVVWSGGIGVIELVTELIPGNQLSPYTGAAAAALISASVCVAILRHRLFDIDLVINRTLVYAMLSTGVVGLYVAVVAAAGAVLGRPIELGPGLLATAVVALAFGPARTRLQHGVDRMMYGERRNPYRVMSQLGRRLENAAGSDELAVVVQTVSQTLKLPYAAIIDPAGRTLAESGTPVSEPLIWPLTYQGSPMGQLLVGARRNQAGFDRAEQQLLEDLVRQIGAAVHAVRLSADLQASRTRLVSAKEEERRRLRRDLHDGLGPKLAALGLKVDAAHALTDDRPGDSKQLMSAVKNDIRTTIDDIRRLVYDLRPPALDELGLAGALREAASRFDDTQPPCISIHAPDRLPAMPAAVEVAAYRIVTEAITNAVRHSQAERCSVHIALDQDGDDALCLRICDDGVGFGDDWRPGVGTESMRERAEELGGELTIRPGPGGQGTEIEARLPWRSAR